MGGTNGPGRSQDGGSCRSWLEDRPVGSEMQNQGTADKRSRRQTAEERGALPPLRAAPDQLSPHKAAPYYQNSPDRRTRDRGSPQDESTPARGVGPAKGVSIQAGGSEGRKRNVLQGREQELRDPETPRITPIYGLQPRLSKMGQSGGGGRMLSGSRTQVLPTGRAGPHHCLRALSTGKRPLDNSRSLARSDL